jgi:trigger factor
MATVTRENIGLLNDKITVTVGKDDYQANFEKTLKGYGKQVNLPGFRKGMVPTGVIKKMHGPSVFVDEVLKTVEKEMNSYMDKEQLEIFAQPLPTESDAAKIDMDSPVDYSFSFEIGLKPAFELPDLAKLPVTMYKVEVTETMVQAEVDRALNQAGKMLDLDVVDEIDNVLNLQFTESDAEGNAIEGGAAKDNSLLVKYFNQPVQDQLTGKKVGDTLVIQPATAFGETEREWILGDLGFDKADTEAANKYFLITITKIGLLEKAVPGEELYKKVFPGREIATEEDFRGALKEDIEKYWDAQGSNQLKDQIYHALLEQTPIEFPVSFLKKWMKNGQQEKVKTEEEVEAEYPNFDKQLRWTLISDHIIRQQQFDVKPEELKNFARKQMMGYMGMASMDESMPWLEEYVNKMMSDKRFIEDTYHRLVTEKLFNWAETQVKPTEQFMSSEEFTKMVEAHKH